MIDSCLSCKDPSLIFVYGASEHYVNGAGAALHAVRFHGAKKYLGPFVGNSYGIPTKDRYLRTLPIEKIRKHVGAFLTFAEAHPEKQFFVTRIGTGLAGYTDADIAPLFSVVPNNVILPKEWTTS